MTQSPSDPPPAHTRSNAFVSFKSVRDFCFVTVPSIIIGLLIFFAISVTFANVVGRYIFHNSIIWAEEVISLTIVGIVFVGAITVSYRDNHLRMDAFSARFNHRVRRVINAFTILLSISVCLLMAVQSYAVAAMLLGFGQTSLIANIPMVVPHSAVMLGFGGIVLALCLNARSALTRGSLSESEPKNNSKQAPRK